TPAGLYETLHARYGDLEWWPAEGPFQVMVGAVLTQRTSWTNVERALGNLADAGVVDMATLLALPIERLEALIRPSGTYRQKALRLLALFAMVDERGNGSLAAFLDRPMADLRHDLLAVKGVGPETADSIILYAAGKPVFVVDAYTRRVLGRLGVTTGGSYDQVARWFQEGLPEDVAVYNNYHAMLVELAKDQCRTRPICEGCPIRSGCPVGRGEESP
nr:endonuclease III domain-containing protein [Thermoplasmata archaeon]NIS11633.1 endonuclease III domain-containing protein [Thermoplasmata archaeon]NIS19539.1 endonuclease III domain-containing protein [Thermoplasmata archaeon]NIT76686.1 endonuclease III domain-containing protein [Thermoplasmata archaeon]NIU48656.1 endonuclease III domain-containing protein [Thermoplasmata archaeon]